MRHQDYINDAVELLSRLIATPSVSRNEKEAADVMQHQMSTYGLATHREANNVWAICPDYDSAKPTILLNAHIDTVKPAISWVRDPFKPTHEGDLLYGLGSNDCGGGLVTLLQVFRYMTLRTQPYNLVYLAGSNDCGGGLATLLQVFRYMTLRTQPYNLVYLASAEEEVSGKDGISRVLPLLPHIDVAIVGEPTGMQPAIAEKGLMVLDVVSHGKSGHAARNEGINAIYEALDWIRDFRFKKVSPFLGPTKMTLTVVHAGTQHNVIPDECRMLVDVRTNEYYTNEEVYDIVRSHVKSDVHAHSFRLHSSRIDPEHPLVKRCVSLGLRAPSRQTLCVAWPAAFRLADTQ